MSVVENLISMYVSKVDGAFMEKKESTIIFDFTDADNQYGYMIAKELGKHIDLEVNGKFHIQKVFG